MENNIVFGKGTLTTHDGKPIGAINHAEWSPGEIEIPFDVSKCKKWPCDIMPIYAPTYVVEIELPRKWWQWIIPLRTIYDGEMKVEEGKEIDGCFEFNFSKNGPMKKRYEWAWAKWK